MGAVAANRPVALPMSVNTALGANGTTGVQFFHWNYILSMLGKFFSVLGVVVVFFFFFPPPLLCHIISAAHWTVWN